ncbi:hypothetical protein IFR05_010469 [Cadophora sp. M221]|nr:hypothetical protein IFR05_010469 [Cadophora sp. M221]
MNDFLASVRGLTAEGDAGWVILDHDPMTRLGCMSIDRRRYMFIGRDVFDSVNLQSVMFTSAQPRSRMLSSDVNSLSHLSKRVGMYGSQRGFIEVDYKYDPFKGEDSPTSAKSFDGKPGK